MYHAIILENSLTDPDSFLEEYVPFAIKHLTDSGWIVQGVEVKDSEIDAFTAALQEQMQQGPWYNHMYNESGELTIVFKDRIYRVETPDDIMPVWEYAKELNIPEEQLQFEPASFEEEEEFFTNGSAD
ncbi:MAG: hypothetical protein TR69_WS6001001047 [candidate division WS6 bacterium OLB20]|uniref:Uncharacterized protein n=1 Tax=candidate division WS6 bacterium OLB20 TaxID=1617426 RepID=A0A136LZF0_9BACT|nr:MAG: hypothetical protein TR69_WS6001001047 [candidate division WS6 bacterium OLB20]